MAENPNNRGEPDRSLVSLGQQHEVDCCRKKFRVSEAKLREVVKAVGNSAAKVGAYLKLG